MDNQTFTFQRDLIFGTQDEDKQNTTQKTKKMNNNDLTKTPGARKGLAVPASYKISQCYSYNRGVLIDTSILKQTPMILYI